MAAAACTGPVSFQLYPQLLLNLFFFIRHTHTNFITA